MIPAPFEYEVAESVDHAVELLTTREDAKLLAGGHSLIPLLKVRLARPGTLVDIGRVSGMVGVLDAGEHLVVGAMTTLSDLVADASVSVGCPLLATTAAQVGDPQVRHRGTIGGSLAHGDPASDLPTTLLALDAELVVRGSGGERTIAAADFFVGFFETALGPDEILTEIRVPKTGAAGTAYLKFHHRAIDWATVGVAVVVESQNGSISSARVALTNMGPAPVRASAVEAALAGADRGAVARAAEAADRGTDPPSDLQAGADYRRHIAKVLTRRALTQALS